MNHSVDCPNVETDVETSLKEVTALISTDRNISADLALKKFTLIEASQILIAPNIEADKIQFSAEWDSLEPDEYLKSDNCFRRRRFALFYYLPVSGELLPFSSPTYYQSVEYNGYAGGVDRDFSPMSHGALKNRFLKELIRFDFQQLPIEQEAMAHPWKVDLHQVRITASDGEEGHPTPEGIHHDGEEFVCIHMINRENCEGGVSTIYDNKCNPLFSNTLRSIMDSIIVWDPHVMHGTSPITPEDPDRPATRDVLLIGFDPSPGLERPKEIEG